MGQNLQFEMRSFLLFPVFICLLLLLFFSHPCFLLVRVKYSHTTHTHTNKRNTYTAATGETSCEVQSKTGKWQSQPRLLQEHNMERKKEEKTGFKIWSEIISSSFVSSGRSSHRNSLSGQKSNLNSQNNCRNI